MKRGVVARALPEEERRRRGCVARRRAEALRLASARWVGCLFQAPRTSLCHAVAWPLPTHPCGAAGKRSLFFKLLEGDKSPRTTPRRR